MRQEAVLSSQIEGAQSSLADLLLLELDEAPGVPLGDVIEVSNHVAALDRGLERLLEGVPLSNRLTREIHGVLLSRGRGAGKNPGEFRRSQNWIGGSRPGNAVFVPPPHTAVPDAKARIGVDLGSGMTPVATATPAHGAGAAHGNALWHGTRNAPAGAPAARVSRAGARSGLPR